MEIKNNKGQALVEFVMILPIALLLVFALIDCGRVLYQKNHLESVLNDVVLSYKSTGKVDKRLVSDDIVSIVTKDDIYITIALKEEVDLMTPFANIVLKDPFVIKTKRVFIYE